MRLRVLAIVIAGVVPLAAASACGDFPEPFDSEKDAVARPVPAAEAAAGFTAAAGLDVQVFAAEPAVRNPIAMAWDPRGRLWVAENYTYAERPTNLELRLRDRVTVFAAGAGAPNRVFFDGLRQLTSLEVGLGGVWLLCPPQLLFVPDADGDAVPDAPPRVMLDGFEVAGQNHHNFANGLRFGPDGWLYGRCGASCPGRVGRPGAADADRVPLAGGIWRYAPRTGRFETLCHGTTNPWGHDWNAFGDGFFVNTVNGHLWQIIPGAHYQRPHTIDPNPYVYQLLDMHADHWHFDTGGGWQKSRDGAANDFGGGHAHAGAVIYLGDDWPAEYRGDLFTWNFHGRRANRERLERHGSGYVARHLPDVLVAADPFFRGIDMGVGPDGAVYALDWSDTGECHEATGVHRGSGRIYRIAGRNGRSRRRPEEISSLGGPELVALLKHPNEWQVRQARLVLAARSAAAPPSADLQGAFASLRELAAGDDALVACRAVLALHACGAADTALLQGLLTHRDEHLRAWAVRLLADAWPLDGVLGPLSSPESERAEVVAAWRVVAADFIRLAASDPSGLVRLALASCLQRLPVRERLSLARSLAGRTEDGEDHNLPLLVWYGLIPVVEADPVGSAAFAVACRWPVTQRLVVRRIATLIDRAPDAVAAIAAAVAAAGDAAVQRNLLAGLADGLAGWRRAPRPAGWDTAVAAVGADPEAAALVRDLSAVFGDGRAIGEIRRLVLDARADVGLRRGALEALIRQGGDLREICLPLLNDRNLLLIAAQGLSTLDDPEVAAALVMACEKSPATVRPKLIAILSSRRSFAGALMAAVDRGSIPADAISPYDVRQIRAVADGPLAVAVEKHFGSGTPVADRRPRIEELRAGLGPEALATADCRRGRAVFDRACGRCHKLFGVGESIGPDLTGGNRTNVDYLLENMVDPSAVVSRDYRMSIVRLVDGRVRSGLVTARDDRTLTLVTPTETLRLATADIEDVTVTAQSPMPEGIIDQLRPDEIRDLVAYLMQPVQVPLP